MMQVRLAPHDEPHLHGHLLALVPKGFILESFANPVRDLFWFKIYDHNPRIEKSALQLDDTPGLGTEFDQKALDGFGTRSM
jgi:L-alanine-DL-glutamate epimerase-like enolase superfamily enzyme